MTLLRIDPGGSVVEEGPEEGVVTRMNLQRQQEEAEGVTIPEEEAGDILMEQGEEDAEEAEVATEVELLAVAKHMDTIAMKSERHNQCYRTLRHYCRRQL